jgi:hypothetical protein
MTTDLLIHATGLVALALNVIALARGCEKSLRLQSGVAGVVWALNNLLLGAHTAAAMSLVSASRTATSAVTMQSGHGVRRAVFAAFVALTLVIGSVTWEGWSSGFLMLATLLSTYAMFFMTGRALRTSMLAISGLWMINAWAYDSWEQMAANAVTAVAALYGAWRVDRQAAAPAPG